MFGSKINIRAKNLRWLATKNDLKVTLPEKSFSLHRLEKGPETTLKTSKKELLSFFSQMSLVRKLEVVSEQLYKAGEIRGFLHLYNGQESVSSGFESVLTPEDSVITAYRCHGFLLSSRCKMDPKYVLAELTGRQAGCSSGKGGSMHMYDAEHNFFGGNGIVGAQVPLGAGLAFANKYKNNGRVSVVYMGDGAFNQGQVFETFNMASIWKLPVVFVVENNMYAMGTSVERASASAEFYKRGDYLPGIHVNGFNVLAVREAARFAVDHAKNVGPILVEANTYRYVGHSVSDPGTTYRTRSEVQSVREKSDCIQYVKALLLDNNLASDSELEQIEDQIRSTVDQAKTFALESPLPSPAELYTDLLTTREFVRGVEFSQSFSP